MRIIEINALDNGAHRNQNGSFRTIPDGWAVIPEWMDTPNFPFGTVEVEDANGVPTVTAWEPGTIPEPEPIPDPEPTTEEVLLELAADHEARLCSIELGV